MTEIGELEAELQKAKDRVAELEASIAWSDFVQIGDLIVRRDLDHDDCDREVVYVTDRMVCYKISPHDLLEAVERCYVRRKDDGDY